MESGSHFTCIKSENKREVVEHFYYQENDEWHSKIHKRAGFPIDNINDTLSSIAENSVMYVVKKGNELCGYFVRYEDNVNLVLEGFHVSKKYRMPDFFNIFWKYVVSKFERDFLTGIYYKNEDAIRHLTRQGFEFYSKLIDDNKEFYIFNFKK